MVSRFFGFSGRNVLMALQHLYLVIVFDARQLAALIIVLAVDKLLDHTSIYY